MIHVLCIDTEPETVQAMRDAGHLVATGELGFRTGRQLLTDPPHEFDLLVCDLRRPACFDATRWGPGLNSNSSCRIERPTDEVFWEADGRARPKFQVIRETQMPPRPVGAFGPTDVFTAVNTGGTPFILFLNPEWLRHVEYTNPNFTDVRWGFERTKAIKLVNTSVMDVLVSGLADSAALAVPLEFAIAESAHRPAVRRPNAFTTVPLVTNIVSQVFAEAVVLENGVIWAIPQFRDNARFCVKLLERFDSFLAAQSSLLAPGRNTTSKMAETIIVDSPGRDVFISHASEDKTNIARPLDAERQYMELAFQEAKKSNNEDGRTHPKVGAVVVKEGTILATAYRGETGPGDHAEFGALEKKLGQEVLSGATVYTTLEPCTSRQHAKMGCAQRLLERGVRRVVIGMHDPNPSISGKGFLLLRTAKIVTELFPDDLMGAIEEINRDFTRTYSSTDQVGPAARPSAREAWVKLENRLVDLEPLYDQNGQPPQYSSFRVREVTDFDVEFQKESNSQTVFLPLSCLSPPWRADSYGGMRAKIDRGKLYFDSDAERWIYQP